MKRLRSFLVQNQLLVSVALTWILIIFTRAAYYLYINVPYVFDDSGGYNLITNQLITGSKLVFTRRLPGYPLFLALPHIVSKSIDFVAYLQTIMSLLSATFFIWSIHKTYKRLTYAAGFAVVVFMTSLIALHNETAVLPESLYTNFLIIFTGFLFLSIKKPAIKYFLGLSLSFTISFFIRPTALFLTPIMVLIAFYIIYNKVGLKFLLYLLLPPIILTLSLMGYNKSVSGLFVLTSQGATDKIGNVMTFAETDPSLPDYMNKILEERILSRSKPEEKQMIENTWNVRNINIQYLRYQSWQTSFQRDIRKVHKGDLALTSEDCNLFFSTMIKNHPKQYKKFLAVSFLHYFNSVHWDKTSSFPFYKDYFRCFRDARVRKYFGSEFNKTGQYYSFTAPKMTQAEAASKIKNIEEKGLSKLSAKFFDYHQIVFRNYFWVAFYFIILLWATFKFLGSRLRDADSFLVLLVVLMNLLNVILIIIANTSFIRYNQTLHYVYYMLPMLTLMLLPDLSLKNLSFLGDKLSLSKRKKQVKSRRKSQDQDVRRRPTKQSKRKKKNRK